MRTNTHNGVSPSRKHEDSCYMYHLYNYTDEDRKKTETRKEKSLMKRLKFSWNHTF